MYWVPVAGDDEVNHSLKYGTVFFERKHLSGEDPFSMVEIEKLL